MTIVVAHRGDSAEFPENTLPAFESAVALGADLVELDFRQTRDGVLVCLHDATLDRTTDCVARGQEKVAVASRDLADVQQFDAGAWKDARFAGTHVPTLADALEAIQRGSNTFLEHKAGDAHTLVALLRQLDLVDTVWVQSFDWGWLREVRAIEPRLRLAALGGDDDMPTLLHAHLDDIAEFAADVVNWHADRLLAADVESIHARGWIASIYTADEIAEFERLVSLGVDVITTNRPARLREFLRSARDPHDA